MVKTFDPFMATQADLDRRYADPPCEQYLGPEWDGVVRCQKCKKERDFWSHSYTDTKFGCFDCSPGYYDYDVVAQPSGRLVGTLVFESRIDRREGADDVFAAIISMYPGVTWEIRNEAVEEFHNLELPRLVRVTRIYEQVLSPSRPSRFRSVQQFLNRAYSRGARPDIHQIYEVNYYDFQIALEATVDVRAAVGRVVLPSNVTIRVNNNLRPGNLRIIDQEDE